MASTWPSRAVLGAVFLLLAAGAFVAGSDDKKDELQLVISEAKRFHENGEHPEALKQYQRALELATDLFGADHEKTAGVLNDLGKLYKDMDQFSKAESLLKRSLEIRETKLGQDHPDVAQTLNDLANVYWKMSQLARAVPLYLRSLRIREAKLGKDDLKVADSLNNLGGLYWEMGQLPKAETFYLRGLQIFETKRGRDSSDVADILSNLAVLYQDMGQLAKAEPLHKRSLEIREVKLGRDHLRVADSLNNLATYYRDTGQLTKAESLYERSLEIYEARLGPDHSMVAAVLHNLADLYEDIGELAKVEMLYQRTLKIFEVKLDRDHPKVAETLNNLANFYLNMGQAARAEPLLKRSLEIKEAKLGRDHLALGVTLNSLANLYRYKGELVKAELLLNRSLAITEAKLGKDHLDLASTFNDLANLYREMGQSAKAELFFKRSLEIKEANLVRDHPDLARTHNNLGLLYREMGQLAKAELHLKRSLEIKEAKLRSNHPDVADSLNNLAIVYRDMGQMAKVEPFLKRTLVIQEANLGRDNPAVGQTLVNLANFYREMGQLATAEPLFDRGLKILQIQLGQNHPALATALNNLMLLRAAQGRWGEAGELADRERLKVRRYVVGALCGLSEKEQLTYLSFTDEKQLHWALSLGLANCGNSDLTKRSASWLLNGKAIVQEALSERAQLARLRTDRPADKVANELLLVRGKLANLTFVPYKEEKAREHQQQLATIAEREHELSKELGRLIGRPTRDIPWVELEEVRKSLPIDSVLVDTFKVRLEDYKRGGDNEWSEPHYAAWVIPTAGVGEVRIVDLGDATKIEQAVIAVRQSLHRPQRDSKHGEPAAEKELAGPLRDLARLVLEPLLPYIADKKEWILSPDAALWLVPWAALPVDKNHYAVETHTIRYVVSGRYVVEPSAKIQTGQPLVMADPDYDLGLQVARAETDKLLQGELRDLGSRLSGGRLPERVRRLPGTAAEAQAIKPSLERWAGAPARIYTDKQALEAVFKGCHSPKAVVLSTHGFFLEDQEVAPAPGLASRGLELVETSSVKPVVLTKEGKPLENPLLRCGLLLAGCNHRDQIKDGDEDGVLTGLEIVGTDLRGTELVVLSACETGLGEVRNGEGVAGLRQAFQLAGAKAVVATLWKIPDQETAALMSDFFNRLADGQSKAEALRGAQLAAIKDRREKFGAAHPFYWAAFTLTGQ